MIINILLLSLGLLILVKGADWLVQGATVLAKKKNISDLAIGLTIVAFGTSAPELVVNVVSAYEGHEDLVFGNVLGSNNFNLLFILGLAGLISPLVVQSSTVWKEIPISLLAAIILLFLVHNVIFEGDQNLSRIDGLVLLIFFCFFLFYVYRQMRNLPLEEGLPVKEMSMPKIIGLIIFGLLGLVIGGRFVVENATDMATALGVSEQIVGLTIVAAGTSLPELATSVVAAFKKNNDIAVGNIVGSNIFNIFFILGISAVIRPIGYNSLFNNDLYLLFGGTILLFLFMFLGGKKRLDRWEAGILLAIYVSYTTYLVLREV